MAIWGKRIIISVNGVIVEGELLQLETTRLTVRMTKPWRSGPIESGHSGLFGFIYNDEINGHGRLRAENYLRTLYERGKTKRRTPRGTV